MERSGVKRLEGKGGRQGTQICSRFLLEHGQQHSLQSTYQLYPSHLEVSRPGKCRQHLFTTDIPVVLIGICLHCTQAIATLFRSVRSPAPPLPVVGWQLAGKSPLLTWLEVNILNTSYNTNQAPMLFLLHYKARNNFSMHTKHAAWFDNDHV